MHLSPSITDYIDTISNHTCFRTLTPIFLKNRDGERIYCSGNGSVIFKVEINDKTHALKLYTSLNSCRDDYFRALKEYTLNHNVNMLPAFTYLEQEIAIYINSELKMYPVLLVEWIEGETLHNKIGKLATLGLRKEITNLTNKFISFAKELISFDFAHIDLKPENIIVSPDNDLTLIDLDALYIPNYKPEYIIEQGTIWYRHPNRKENRYERHLHDYPIMIITATLLSLEKRMNLYEKYSNGDNLIFSPHDIMNKSDNAYHEVCEIFNNGIEKEVIDTLTSESVKISNIDKLLNILYYIRTGEFNLNNNNGELPIFDDYIEVGNGITAVQFSNLWYLINSDCKVLNNFTISKINRFSENKIAIFTNGEWQVLNELLNLLFSFNADEATFYSKNRLAVKRGDKWGYLNEKGDIVIDFKFDIARKFNNNLIAEVKENGVLKEININGD